MTTPAPEPQSRLEQLGYSQQLERRLSIPEVVGLAMADVSPTMAVLFLSAGVFVVGGTFSIGAGLILSVIVVLISFCLGELAGMFPIAGGMYSLVSRVLPGPLSWITMFNYLIQGVVIPASVALGIVAFLKDLIPGLGVPDTIVAVILLAMATALALTKVEVGAWATAAMVVVECIVLGIITVAALLHPHQHLADVTLHPVVLNGGQLTAVSFAVMLATLAPAFNVINGYDAALGFSEELKGGEKKIAKTVILSAILACILIMVPLISAVVAAPDLKDFFNAPAPVIYSVEASLGAKARIIIDVGVIIALFNAMLSLLMYFGRGVYTTGRDGVWPVSVNRVIGSLNRFRAPGAGVMVLAIPAAVLVFTSALNFLIIFAGTVIAAVYLCIGLAAFWSRRSMPSEPRPYKMPLWPLPPLIVIGFTGLALATQETQYLIGEVVLIVVALACWAGSKKWSPKRPETNTATIEHLRDETSPRLP
ncbi:APC family permease [Mycolicibacterium sp. P9-64]|uniref:APC family permease n=1 Tax=Mycolicibacterium sp. P9-64 TaxID=2024612 RepID=UPI0011EC4E8F|nr:APC family permease [Mycolicibacterium sp. P9-64]KAA0077202.1 APC family permease [Mycolicibacterium sp. P9-64]